MLGAVGCALAPPDMPPGTPPFAPGTQPPTPPSEISHNYSSEWTATDTTHYHACIDTGYETLKADEAEHSLDNQVILTQPTESQVGLAQYTCSVCNHTYTKNIYVETEILTAPTASGYIGQTLGAVSLNGGSATVGGTFSWQNPSQMVTQSGNYDIVFTPNNSAYQTLTATAYVTATQLTVTVAVGENGSSNYDGEIEVNYGSNLNLFFTPDADYEISTITVDGNIANTANQYSLVNITQNHTVEVTFAPKVVLPFNLVCALGTPNAYTFDESTGTLTFTEISAETIYQISGDLTGNIVVNAGETYNFELEMQGFTLTSETACPLVINTADNFSLKAKSGYQNYIYDNRPAVPADDLTQYSASVYSLVDLTVCGKGSLTVVSQNNNGIHTKDDLKVKNLTLCVDCRDNALKGNDSVTVTNCATTLIARVGDCIKSTNSAISTTNQVQRGIITVAGGTHNLYSACDGIDASYNAVITDGTILTAGDNPTTLNIYTDKYSSYSEEVTVVTESTYYIRYNSTAYNYSIKYYNSETDYVWENASTTYETVSSGRNTYYYYTVNKKSGYSYFKVYMYSSGQSQGQESSYYACSSNQSLNDNYDTIALSYRNSSLSLSWTNYSTSTSGGMGGMGGMQDGNTDKGTYSTKGIKAENTITISGGTVNIQAYDDAIHASNTAVLENGATPLGAVNITGGKLTLSSNDDAIHGDGAVDISGGVVSVLTAYEGIEGATVTIGGGALNITSTDDGINSPGTITVNDGNIFIYAKGDGIDSNNTASYQGILFNGGRTVVICQSGGNSSLDTDGGYSYSGGYVIALTTSGGMSSEAEHCNNFSSVATASTVSLTSGQYLNVTVNSTVVATVKMPCTMNAATIYLGSNSASLTSATTTTNSLNASGVYWGV